MKRLDQLTQLTAAQLAQDDIIGIRDQSAGQTKYITVKDLTGSPDFGWQATAESWAFSSYSSTTLIGVVTVPTDATTKYSVGMRVSFTQTTGGKKYGTIIALTSTTLSLIFAGGAVLNNEAITAPVFSTLNAPYSGSVNLSDEGNGYSTSEIATRYKWIDGKTIYKKTVNFGALPNNTVKTVAHSISGMTRMLRVETNAFDATYMYMLPHTNVSALINQMSIYADTSLIYIATGSDRSAITTHVTLYYIK